VVTPRFLADADLLRNLGLEITEQRIGEHVIATYIAANANGATNVLGAKEASQEKHQ
jgi:hypothetical protein